MTTTRWFPAKQQPPTRPGWYEVSCIHGLFPATPQGYDRLFWCRGFWFIDDLGTRDAYACSFGRACDKWRGLLTPNSVIGDSLTIPTSK